MIHRIFILLLFLSLASFLAADQLVLKDGRTLDGTVKIRKNMVTCIHNGDLFQFPKNQIQSINGVKMEELKNPVIRIVTSVGEIQCEIFEDKTPNTAANIIELAEKGFYNDMSFHRIINGFMAQGGCPNSKPGAKGIPGTGGPGYTFDNECRGDLRHDARGILSMANAGPDTNGSQFFLCFVPCPWLDGHHTVFGKVISGMEVLDKLEAAGTDSGRPKSKITFKIEVVSKQDHPYTVKKN